MTDHNLPHSSIDLRTNTISSFILGYDIRLKMLYSLVRRGETPSPSALSDRLIVLWHAR